MLCQETRGWHNSGKARNRGCCKALRLSFPVGSPVKGLRGRVRLGHGPAADGIVRPHVIELLQQPLVSTCRGVLTARRWWARGAPILGLAKGVFGAICPGAVVIVPVSGRRGTGTGMLGAYRCQTFGDLYQRARGWYGESTSQRQSLRYGERGADGRLATITECTTGNASYWGSAFPAVYVSGALHRRPLPLRGRPAVKPRGGVTRTAAYSSAGEACGGGPGSLLAGHRSLSTQAFRGFSPPVSFGRPKPSLYPWNSY